MTGTVKTAPEKSPNLEQYAFLESDVIKDPFNGGRPPKASNKIEDYRKLQNWENYFICSAICSVGKKLGSDIDDFHFYANFTGDNFAYMYPAEKGNPDKLYCDSGLTSCFFLPQLVKKPTPLSDTIVSIFQALRYKRILKLR